MNRLLSLTTARVLIVLGFIVTLISIGATFSHLGKPEFLFVGSGAAGGTHAWHHLFREGVSDFGDFACIFLLIFAAPRFRSTVTWWAMVVIALGFYLPYWIGVPFNPGLAAPHEAEIGHITQAVLVGLGLLIARRHYVTAEAASIPSRNEGVTAAIDPGSSRAR